MSKSMSVWYGSSTKWDESDVKSIAKDALNLKSGLLLCGGRTNCDNCSKFFKLIDDSGSDLNLRLIGKLYLWKGHHPNGNSNPASLLNNIIKNIKSDNNITLKTVNEFGDQRILAKAYFIDMNKLIVHKMASISGKTSVNKVINAVLKYLNIVEPLPEPLPEPEPTPVEPEPEPEPTPVEPTPVEPDPVEPEEITYKQNLMPSKNIRTVESVEYETTVFSYE